LVSVAPFPLFEIEFEKLNLTGADGHRPGHCVP
jgi:hypothetical protein